MAWDGVPWFVGGGAEHTPEVARLLGYAAFRGNEGVIGIGDLQVKALATPGSSIRVMPGACSILNRASAQTYQAYAARLPTEDAVPVSATTSGGGRSDLVVARIEDPWLAGEPWADPADPKAGPYVYTRIITNVPPTTRTYKDLGLADSAIALGRIDIPSSTATITQAMITDLRKVANPRRERSVLTANPASTETLTSSSFVAWPTAASWQVDVPAWATKVILRGAVSGLKIPVGVVAGQIRVTLGTAVSQATGWDETVPSGANYDRKNWAVSDTVAIPSAMRGTRQTVRLEGLKTSGSTSPSAETLTSAALDIEFVEEASLV